MILIIGLIFIYSIIYGLLYQRNIYNPLTLFCGFMSGITILSSLQLYKMNDISEISYIIMILGIFGFFVGTLTVNFVNKKRVSQAQNFDQNQMNSLNEKFIFIAVLSMTIFSISRFLTILPLLLKGYALDYIRLIYFGNEFNGIGINRSTAIIEMFINLPLFYGIIPIISIDIISRGRNIGRFTIILTIIWISLSTIVSGGRATIYIVAIVLFFSALIYNKRLKLTRKTKISLVIFLFASIVFMFIMTINRTQSGEYNILYSLYVYFAGCLAHMSYRLETIDFSYFQTFGLTFLSGALRPLMLIYKWIFGDFPQVYQRTLDIGVELQSAVDIGTGKTFNAFVPSFFYFYFDFGYIGVFVESLLYGIICQYFYIKMKLKLTVRNAALYLLIIQGMLTSMIRFPFILVYYTYAFIVILFLTKQHPEIKRS